MEFSAFIRTDGHGQIDPSSDPEDIYLIKAKTLDSIYYIFSDKSNIPFCSTGYGYPPVEGFDLCIPSRFLALLLLFLLFLHVSNAHVQFRQGELFCGAGIFTTIMGRHTYGRLPAGALSEVLQPFPACHPTTAYPDMPSI